ncbi:glucosamine-6-phosphate deaminase [Globicatella sanguinis]|uniref:glucosamine-6-phosphate deaminase n=1 Tax=Globicatella sanguinis TaxID=13076 RepID=UPI0008241A8A|nr:glucosamine-6-phosphate deaminase [Globicatella sanguinis]
MEFLTFKTMAEGSQKAFEIIKEAKENGANTFGLATGSTPEKLYELIVASDLDFTDSISINLDEYYGLSGEHPQSYRYFMQQHLFNHKPFKETYVPDGLNTDAEAEAARYEAIIDENPIDVQILGIGENGHIGFNEPGTSFDAKTALVDLTDSTIQANKRYFESEADVPRQAYSMGIASIMKSKKIILMAFGKNKANAIKQLMAGEVTTDCPATVLINHPDVTVIVDEDAASLI